MISVCMAFILSLSSYAQIDRNLDNSYSVNQQNVNKDLQLRDYYKLITEPSLMKRGKAQVYKNEFLEAIQFPVGGIGTGCIQFDGKARPRFWQIFNNMTHDHIPNSFFAVRVESDQGNYVRALQTQKVNEFQEMAKLEASSAFPFLSYHFMDDIPIDVKMDVFNPFIPTDLKNSEIPAVFYRFTFENTSDDSVEVSLLASQQNAVGFSQIPKIVDGDSFAERYEKSLEREPVLGNSSNYYGGNINQVFHNDKSISLLMEGTFPASDEHFGQMALLMLKGQDGEQIQGTAGWEDSSELHDFFSKTGAVEEKRKTRKSKDGKSWSGALSNKFTLQVGEKKTIYMALVWYFPNGLNGGHLDNWDAWGKGKWQGVGNNYANHWKNMNELTSYVVENYQWLMEKSEQFSNSFYNTNIPYWLVERIGNQLNILKSRTIFYDKRGYVGLWEGCGSGDGSCAGNCNHVWHYAQAHARLFPELAKKIKEQSFSAIKDDGQVPYRQPAGSPAFDGQCGDIIGAYREYLLSTDKKWLVNQYPMIKKAMNYLVEKHDADKDGWLSDSPKHTTYDASMTGNPSFLSSLYLAALKSSARMALVCGDEKQSNEWDTIAANSAKLQNERLWNGEYFIQEPGAKRATDYENGCMSDQLLGLWWADQIGIKDLYPDYRAYSAFRAIMKYNFKSNLLNHVQLARKFAKPEEAGIVVASWPNKDRTSYASGYSDEVWTSFEYTVGASLIKYGRIDEAFALLKAGYKRYDGRLKTGYKTNNGWGNFGFSGNPFGDDECGQFYSRALSCWSVLLAIQGFEYNGPEGKIGFHPKWKKDDFCSFFSTTGAWGTFTQKMEGNIQKTRLALDFGNLLLNQFHTNKLFTGNVKNVSVMLNGEEIGFKLLQSDELTIQFDSFLNLSEGDHLEIYFK